MPPTSSATGAARIQQDSRGQEILSAQIRLLYANSNIAAGITIAAATTLALLQWGTVPNFRVLGWWVYMTLVSVSRSALARSYGRASPAYREVSGWRTAFVFGAGLAGAGWGGAGILLYPQAHLTNQLFLVFVLGGMMLGAGFLLAARPEAFLAFLIPTGLVPTIRLLVQGDEMHSAMGILTAVFTLTTVITTGRIYRTIGTSLRLQFENRDLVEDLRAAKNQTEALNQALELRVQERTAELHGSTEQLKAEIAKREQMEEELLRTRKLESLGVLAGGIAHDFNNFLAIINGNIDLVKARLDVGSPAQGFLDQIAAACQRAALLASQLLTFAKGGAPIRRVVPVAKLVVDAVHLARAGTPTSITVQIAEDLGFAEVDPGQISQVLHNILLNARQTMPEGGIIEVRAENIMFPSSSDAGPRVRISIRDYGCGIPADVLHRIFDPYFTTKPGGSGLGLATAYAIVAKHGGHIGVESKLGEGTVFTIDLPACQESPAPPAPVVTNLETGTERVLVMDDNEAVRKVFEGVLNTLGYEVQTARDGAEAIAVYEQAKVAGKRFDAVLLDLTVSGGMGGVEAAAKLKEMDPSSKLIVSSGYSDAPVMSDFAKYGFDAVITKPSTLAEISAAFRRVLVADPDRKAD
jgi:signal transduction histidine kinase/ActR/RegA family two-component response regulator